MGHKTHPKALRLTTTAAHDAVWYADRRYADLALHDAALRSYFKEVASSARVYSAPLVSHVFPKEHRLTAFIHTPHHSMQAHKKAKTPKKGSAKTGLGPLRGFQRPISPVAHLVSKGTPMERGSRHLLAHLVRNPTNTVCIHKGPQRATPQQHASAPLPLVPTHLMACAHQDVLRNTLAARGKKRKISVRALQAGFGGQASGQTPLRNAMNHYATHHAGMETAFRVVKHRNLFASAAFVADYVARSLEAKKSVASIWGKLTKRKQDLTHLLGIRLTVGGRLNGKEIASVTTQKYGRTPLHTFSKKMDYATGRAKTGYGALGVKVWLCFKDEAELKATRKSSRA